MASTKQLKNRNEMRVFRLLLELLSHDILGHVLPIFFFKVAMRSPTFGTPARPSATRILLVGQRKLVPKLVQVVLCISGNKTQ